MIFLCNKSTNVSISVDTFDLGDGLTVEWGEYDYTDDAGNVVDSGR